MTSPPPSSFKALNTSPRQSSPTQSHRLPSNATVIEAEASTTRPSIHHSLPSPKTLPYPSYYQDASSQLRTRPTEDGATLKRKRSVSPSEHLYTARHTPPIDAPAPPRASTPISRQARPGTERDNHVTATPLLEKTTTTASPVQGTTTLSPTSTTSSVPSNQRQEYPHGPSQKSQPQPHSKVADSSRTSPPAHASPSSPYTHPPRQQLPNARHALPPQPQKPAQSVASPPANHPDLPSANHTPLSSPASASNNRQHSSIDTGNGGSAHANGGTKERANSSPISHANPNTNANANGNDATSTTPTDAKKRKRNFSNRTKTGCLTCRKRKKKCDEQKPHCSNCVRGGFPCAGYPPQRSVTVWPTKPEDTSPHSAVSAYAYPSRIYGNPVPIPPHRLQQQQPQPQSNQSQPQQPQAPPQLQPALPPQAPPSMSSMGSNPHHPSRLDTTVAHSSAVPSTSSSSGPSGHPTSAPPHPAPYRGPVPDTPLSAVDIVSIKRETLVGGGGGNGGGPYRGPSLRISPPQGRPLMADDDRPTASSLPNTSITSPNAGSKYPSYSLPSAAPFPTPISANTSGSGVSGPYHGGHGFGLPHKEGPTSHHMDQVQMQHYHYPPQHQYYRNQDTRERDSRDGRIQESMETSRGASSTKLPRLSLLPPSGSGPSGHGQSPVSGGGMGPGHQTTEANSATVPPPPPPPESAATPRQTDINRSPFHPHPQHISHPVSAPPATGPLSQSFTNRPQRSEMLAGRPFHPLAFDLLQDRHRSTVSCWRFNHAVQSALGLKFSEQQRLFREIIVPTSYSDAKMPPGANALPFAGAVGQVGEDTVAEAPFHCDYGYNIFVGRDVHIQRNCSINDCTDVRIGDSCTIGANVQILTSDLARLSDSKFREGGAGVAAANASTTGGAAAAAAAAAASGTGTGSGPASAASSTSTTAGSWGLYLAKPVIIENRCAIGAGSTILPGVTIGQGSEVRAASVVTQDVPPFTVVAGNPARVISGVV